ncbi:MAG: hypothetical protein ACLRSW_11690 [Christensenellaceae bacterium]
MEGRTRLVRKSADGTAWSKRFRFGELSRGGDKTGRKRSGKGAERKKIFRLFKEEADGETEALTKRFSLSEKKRHFPKKALFRKKTEQRKPSDEGDRDGPPAAPMGSQRKFICHPPPPFSLIKSSISGIEKEFRQRRFETDALRRKFENVRVSNLFGGAVSGWD